MTCITKEELEEALFLVYDHCDYLDSPGPHTDLTDEHTDVALAAWQVIDQEAPMPRSVLEYDAYISGMVRHHVAMAAIFAGYLPKG